MATQENMALYDRWGKISSDVKDENEEYNAQTFAAASFAGKTLFEQNKFNLGEICSRRQSATKAEFFQPDQTDMGAIFSCLTSFARVLQRRAFTQTGKLVNSADYAELTRKLSVSAYSRKTEWEKGYEEEEREREEERKRREELAKQRAEYEALSREAATKAKAESKKAETATKSLSPEEEWRRKESPRSDFEIVGTTLKKYKGHAEKVVVPWGITTIDSGDYSGTFYRCNTVKEVILPPTVKTINSYAFSYCENLERIELPESLIEICANAVTSCKKLKSIHIPGSVTKIGHEGLFNRGNIFYYCADLETITVDINNKAYHSEGNCLIETATKTLLCGCNNSVIPSDGSVTSIGENAFCGSRKLNRISIPKSISKIDNYAFSMCYALTSITIPNSVTSIGHWAFFACNNLQTVTMPKMFKREKRKIFKDVKHVKYTLT